MTGHQPKSGRRRFEMTRLRYFTGVVLLVLALVPSCWAEVVELKNGQRIEGKLSAATSDHIFIDVDGKMRAIKTETVRAVYFGDVGRSVDGRRERLAKAQADARLLASAVSIYSAHMGALPPTLATLTVPATNAKGQTAGPFLRDLPDPPEGWTPYSYRQAPGGRFTVMAEGDGTQVSIP